MPVVICELLAGVSNVSAYFDMLDECTHSKQPNKTTQQAWKLQTMQGTYTITSSPTRGRQGICKQMISDTSIQSSAKLYKSLLSTRMLYLAHSNRGLSTVKLG